MITTKHFNIKELVPESLIKVYGEKDSWNFIKPEAIMGLNIIRLLWNKPLIINTWAYGGNIQFRGWRPMDCEIGAKHSSHKEGLAFDLVTANPSDHKALWELVRDSHSLSGATEIENIKLTPTWVHVSWRNFPQHPTKIKIIGA